MPMPGDSDDDWAELARELDRDKPQPTAEQPSQADDGGAPFESPAEAAIDDAGSAPDGIDEPEGDSHTEGQPGSGRKRRRRRRRRRRGGAEQGAEAAPAEIGAAEGEESGSADIVEGEFEPADA